MHAAYFNDPRIQHAWKQPARSNLSAETVRDRHIRAGLLTPMLTLTPPVDAK